MKTRDLLRNMREERDLSREAATRILPGITVKRLEHLESGETAISPEDIVLLAKAYDAPQLRNHFCRQDCPIGCMDTPRVICPEEESIYQILVRMDVALDEAVQGKERLKYLLKDGIITPGEKKEFEKICSVLEEISSMIESLQLWTEKWKEKVAD